MIATYVYICHIHVKTISGGTNVKYSKVLSNAILIKGSHAYYNQSCAILIWWLDKVVYTRVCNVCVPMFEKDGSNNVTCKICK